MAPVLSSLHKVIEVLRGGWTYRVFRLHGAGRKSDVKIRHYNDLVSSTANVDVDGVERRDNDAATIPYSEEDSEEYVLSSEDSDTSGEDSDSYDAEDQAPSSRRPVRNCGPPPRLVIDPSRKRYEET